MKNDQIALMRDVSAERGKCVRRSHHRFLAGAFLWESALETKLDEAEFVDLKLSEVGKWALCSTDFLKSLAVKIPKNS